jgi:hypothetical protein
MDELQNKNIKTVTVLWRYFSIIFTRNVYFGTVMKQIFYRGLFVQ